MGTMAAKDESSIRRPPPGGTEETTLATGASRSTTLSTDAAVGRRKTFGREPMKIAIATTGAMTSHSRDERSGSVRFFSLVTSP
jgi:hypothetical protein